MGFIYLSNLDMIPFNLDGFCGFSGSRPEVIKVMRASFSGRLLIICLLSYGILPRSRALWGFRPYP
jgi:hypothetical protein